MAKLVLPSIIETMTTGVVAATEQTFGPGAALWRIEFHRDGSEAITRNGKPRGAVPVNFLRESRAVVSGYVQACRQVHA